MPIKMSKEDFINKSNEIHLKKYDYSEVIYVNSKSKVKIICPTHGLFSISPNLHTSRKSGCQKCSYETRNKVMSIPEFIRISTEIHSNKFNYKLVNYKITTDYIKIICPIHGIFEQKGSSHLHGKGCKKCYLNRERSNINKFISLSESKFGNRYDYSKFNYINSKTKSIIICENNHEIMVSPNHHLLGYNFCKECHNENYKSKWLSFLEKLKYFEYLKFNGDIINIKCTKCSLIFSRKCSAHLKLGNCPYCSPNHYDNDLFIKKSKEIHGDTYNYSEVKYIDTKGKIKLTCKKNHSFYQNAGNHLNGTGCPKCNRFNIKELSVFDFLSDNTNFEIISSNRSILNGKELDIYIPDLNLAFEFNGLYWHSELYKEKNYHLDKTRLCFEKGIQLIHIWEDDWTNKKDIVKSIILNKLGKSNKIYARKCVVKEVNDNVIIREFLNKNHIQGFVGSKVKIGLYYNDKLVSIMTFGNLRRSLGQKGSKGTYELIRFCNILNTSIIGGASKLLKYFLDNYDVKEIISYSDYSRSNGNMYKKLGFSLSHNSIPNYYYIIDGIRKHRFNFRKDKLIKDGFDATKTEIEIMNERGLYRIFDCGMQKWIFIK